MRRCLPAFVLLVVSGCGPSKGGSGGGAIPFDQLASEYARVFCQKAFVCCDAVELQSVSGSEAECRSALSADLMGDLTGDQTGVAMGTTIYDGAKARACLDIVTALPCSEWGADDKLRRFPDCLHILHGTIAPGGACARSGECLDGLCDTSSGSGACVARAALGESCASATCRSELYCPLDASGRPIGLYPIASDARIRRTEAIAALTPICVISVRPRGRALEATGARPASVAAASLLPAMRCRWSVPIRS